MFSSPHYRETDSIGREQESHIRCLAVHIIKKPTQLVGSGKPYKMFSSPHYAVTDSTSREQEAI